MYSRANVSRKASIAVVEEGIWKGYGPPETTGRDLIKDQKWSPCHYILSEQDGLQIREYYSGQ